MAGAPSFSLKAGATLRIAGVATQDSGAAHDLTGATLTAKLRDAGGTVVDTLAVTLVSAAAGTFTIEADDTSDWPAGLLRGDLRIALAGGDVVFSEDFTIRVTRPVTR